MSIVEPESAGINENRPVVRMARFVELFGDLKWELLMDEGFFFTFIDVPDLLKYFLG